MSGVSLLAQTTPQKEKPARKPLSYGMVVDRSGSIRPALEQIIRAAKRIVENNSGDDKTFVVGFINRDKTSVLEDLTENTSLIGDAIDNLYTEGGQSEISEAILLSAKYLVENETDSTREKGLVVITDGDERADNVDKKKMQELLAYLKENKIRVYFLGIPWVAKKESSAAKYMKTIAEATQGKVFTVDRANNWNAAADELVNILF